MRKLKMSRAGLFLIFAIALCSSAWATRGYTHGVCTALGDLTAASELIQRAGKDAKAAKLDAQGVNTVFYFVAIKSSTQANLSSALQQSQLLIRTIESEGDPFWSANFQFKTLEDGQYCSDAGKIYIEYNILLNETPLAPSQPRP